MRLPHPLLTVVVAVGLSACGSTVQQSSTLTGPQGGAAGAAAGAGDGLALPADPGLEGTAAVGGAGGTASGAGPDAAGGAGPGAGPGAGGRGAAPAAAGGPGGPGAPAIGITPTTIYLGGVYSTDAAAANAALGAAGANSGDARDYYDAVMAEVNSRGGVLGRRLEGVYTELRSSAGSIDQQYQAGCDKWFQDQKVFAVQAGHDVVNECSGKAGAVAVSGYLGGVIGPDFARYPHLVAPTDTRLERLSAVTVDAMVRLRWHVPDATWPTGRIGVVTWDDPTYRFALEQGLEPALRRHGLTAAEKAFVKVPQTVGSLSDSSAAVNSAVLRFQAQGIDHVFIQDGQAGVFGGAGLTLLFLQSAESQGYRPRYGFNGNNAPANPILPRRQQQGMLAVDNSSYTPQNDEGIAPNATRERCFAVMRKERLDVAGPTTQLQATQACDFVWFVEQVLARSQEPTRAGFLRAVDGLGTGFGAATVYGTRLGAGRRDGAELFRTSRYDDGCSCMRYTSAPFAP